MEGQNKNPNQMWVPREVIRIEFGERRWLRLLLQALVRNRVDAVCVSSARFSPATTTVNFTEADFQTALHMLQEINEPCGWVKSRRRRFDDDYDPQNL